MLLEVDENFLNAFQIKTVFSSIPRGKKSYMMSILCRSKPVTSTDVSFIAVNANEAVELIVSDLNSSKSDGKLVWFTSKIAISKL